MRRGILVLAAGAAWESAALAVVESEPALVLLRRCVDVEDLLACLGLGQAEGVVVSLDAPGLDTDAVTQIRQAGVRLVALTGVRSEAAQARAARIGIEDLIETSALARVGALLLAGPGASAPHPPEATGSGTKAVSGAGGSAADAADAADTADTAGETGETGPSGSRVLTVCGTRGAAGASTVAIGVAATLARRGETVTLIDLDSRGGSIAQQIGILDEVSGLLAVARLAASGQIAAAWQRCARTVAPGWQVITGVPRADRWREVGPGAIEELIASAAEVGWVVLDAGIDPTPEASAASAETIVVALPDAVGVARLCRTLEGLSDSSNPSSPSSPSSSAGQQGRIRVVMNRWRGSVATTERELMAVLAQAATPVAVHLLPDDQKACDRASLAQRSLVELSPGAGWSQALGRVVDELVPPTRARRRRAGTSRLR